MTLLRSHIRLPASLTRNPEFLGYIHKILGTYMFLWWCWSLSFQRAWLPAALRACFWSCLKGTPGHHGLKEDSQVDGWMWLWVSRQSLYRASSPPACRLVLPLLFSLTSSLLLLLILISSASLQSLMENRIALNKWHPQYLSRSSGLLKSIDFWGKDLKQDGEIDGQHP